MPIINIQHQGKKLTKNFKTGESLLKILLDHNMPITANCGGKGTCGKCKVDVKEEGIVLACQHYPEHDFEVHLPNTGEAKILSTHMLNDEMNTSESTLAESENNYGLAIDIGTTSVVFYWVNLQSGNIDHVEGIQNPQTCYGADVITRINHCAAEEGLFALQKLIVDAINDNILAFLAKDSSVSLCKISVAANTCMLHLLTGVDPMPMALAPFIAPFTNAKIVAASSLGIKVNEDIKIHLLPSASAFVGADIVAGITSLNPPENIQNYLFLDIGTNGEMAVVTPEKIYACATAAGPAFEGATISCGMGAFDGAISAFDKKGYHTIGDKAPVGICGSGLIDIMAYLLENGIVESEGNLSEDYVLVKASESAHKEAVYISPQDIREVQLAKSAIFTGIKLLLQEANLDFSQLDSVYLAGGFGNYMNPDNAVKIGLIPHDEQVPVVPVGNTSGAGAVLHVLHPEFNDKINTVLHKITTIDLSEHPDFGLEFAMNMYF
ncbi:hypothetical protein BZG02_07855 [Labilibaculum filiforme]|uniref:2Fe-2S ferredoxin-type domain-containing protein n=1 Tax=Labilibaculum filiforme TaxID=1940526 RepID=A0A2N3I0R5_9BACT|nr:ASKHA domain-containing protein [Labilibaculum filiforme]PKQ63916.1 hypothetical protein BZG02_07855 [Labilibaculum filiforme]